MNDFETPKAVFYIYFVVVYLLYQRKTPIKQWKQELAWIGGSSAGIGVSAYYTRRTSLSQTLR